ncbi:hypothetical protein D9M69_569410 [compost metagenome]
MLLALEQGGLELGVLGRQLIEALLQCAESLCLLIQGLLGFCQLLAYIALGGFQRLGSLALGCQLILEAVTICMQLLVCSLGLSQTITQLSYQLLTLLKGRFELRMLIAERLIAAQQLVVILSLDGHLLASLGELLTRLTLARCRYLGAGIQVS